MEIDIVVDGEMPLWKAHDIAQDLQDQLEDLPNINRCFVHIDHETEHKPVRIIHLSGLRLPAVIVLLNLFVFQEHRKHT